MTEALTHEAVNDVLELIEFDDQLLVPFNDPVKLPEKADAVTVLALILFASAKVFPIYCHTVIYIVFGGIFALLAPVNVNIPDL